MNMLFNTEKPRFDSHLQSAPPAPAARCGCVRVAGARNTAARERRWVPSFRFRRLPWRVCAAAGRERLGSRFLKAPGQAAAAPARRRARNHAQPARMSPSVPFWLFDYNGAAQFTFRSRPFPYCFSPNGTSRVPKIVIFSDVILISA